MKAKRENIQLIQGNKSFICYENTVPAFDFVWHFHPEYELTYIIKGSGRRLVGDSIENFKEGDMVLLGPHLPHSWVSEKKQDQPCVCVVIQFSEQMIEPFLQMPEFEEIRSLLKKAMVGLVFDESQENSLSTQIRLLPNMQGLTSVTSLLNLLSALCSQKNRPLLSFKTKTIKYNTDTRRINKVLDYIQHTYNQKITITKAASLVHLSESAFCKYFKRSIGKTFSDYVNDLRIAQACTLLHETDKPIGMIAAETGFENLSYFNRVFLKKKKMKPSNYRIMYQ